MYLIYLAFQHYPSKKGASLQQLVSSPRLNRINKKLHTLMQATANNTGDRDTSLLYYAIQRELLSRTEDFVSLIGDGMELYISIQCYHVLVYHFEVAAQFFVELLSYDNMRYLMAFKQTHTKVVC
ncbi:MAG: hypothetical protein P4M11_12505 [Candidatus Pacebacteria bacterium]|nr:hypothetical protein [Candidatus Paceibacterota bacterium]